jgi:hypothetical protein
LLLFFFLLLLLETKTPSSLLVPPPPPPQGAVLVLVVSFATAVTASAAAKDWVNSGARLAGIVRGAVWKTRWTQEEFENGTYKVYRFVELISVSSLQHESRMRPAQLLSHTTTAEINQSIHVSSSGCDAQRDGNKQTIWREKKNAATTTMHTPITNTVQ